MEIPKKVVETVNAVTVKVHCKVCDSGCYEDECHCGESRRLKIQCEELRTRLSTLLKASEGMEKALESYKKAYEPDGHVKPNDCFATGPNTGDAFEDLVVCPACRANNLATHALADFRALKETK